MKHLLTLIAIAMIIACNSSEEKITYVPTELDSVIMEADSTYNEIVALDSTVGVITEVFEDRIKEIEEDKRLLVQQLEFETTPVRSYTPDYEKESEKDKKIKELTVRINGYEKEIRTLKIKIFYDSLYNARTNNKVYKAEEFVDKPDDNSLVVAFDNKMKEGEIPLESISVYIIPFKKEAKKLMNYEVYCDYAKLNDLEGKQAGYFEGKYFFNGIPPGKYLIKVCYYYGGYTVVKRTKGHQVVEMKVAPPIQ